VPVSGDDLTSRLQGRRHELEQALFTRVCAVGDRSIADAEYLDSLRAAVEVAVDHSFAVIEQRELEPPPVPSPILIQARLAARHSVGLDVVLQGYLTGSALIDELILDVVTQDDRRHALRARTVAFERLMAAISKEYKEERERRIKGLGIHRLEPIQALLRGEPVDRSSLDYPLQRNHTAMIAKGRDVTPTIRSLAKLMDSRVLLVHPDEETTWA
jgi:hypothetical protein